MEFDFKEHSDIPRLAWCARVRRGAMTVRVDHGPGVETRPNGFFEGAWNGAFADMNPSRATACFGSGGELRADRVCFVTPTHMLERIHAIEGSDELIVSNSLPFVLAAAGETLDPSYKFYHFDLMTNMRGYRRYLPSVRLQSGRALRVFFHCNVLVAGDLTVRTEAKNLPPMFANYDAYLAYLRSVVKDVQANAQDSARRTVYRPLATISSGYDSPAVARLATEAGCAEAITFGSARPGYEEEDDSGRDIAAVLGLSVREFDRLTYRSMDSFPEAEFLAYGAGGEEVVFAPLTDVLTGRVLYTGYLGDAVWSRVSRRVNTELLMLYPGGSSLGEFRLRSGFIHFPLPTVGYIRHPSIYAISNSAELAPWALGNDYDRPIPRRLIEEIGVPRAAFGRTKKAITQPLWLTEQLESVFSPRSFEDFSRFIAAIPMFAGSAERAAFQAMRGLYEANLRVNWRLQSLAKRLGFVVEEQPLISDHYSRDRGPSSLTFHWGVARTTPRYASVPRGAATSGA